MIFIFDCSKHLRRYALRRYLDFLFFFSNRKCSLYSGSTKRLWNNTFTSFFDHSSTKNVRTPERSSNSSMRPIATAHMNVKIGIRRRQSIRLANIQRTAVIIDIMKLALAYAHTHASRSFVYLRRY